MYCKNCGAEVDSSAMVCLKCGVKVGDGNKFCAKCGYEHNPLATACVSCGHNIKDEKPVTTFKDAIKACFNKYATFEGRANRAEYWWWTLFCLIIGCASVAPVLGWILSLALLLPSITVTVRRLHDIGKSGLYYLICFIPLIGSIILIILCIQPSQEGENEYGANPNY